MIKMVNIMIMMVNIIKMVNIIEMVNIMIKIVNLVIMANTVLDPQFKQGQHGQHMVLMIIFGQLIFHIIDDILQKSYKDFTNKVKIVDYMKIIILRWLTFC